MVRDFYSASSLHTEIYAERTATLLGRSSVAGDLEFYSELARETGGPVLELGCGTGRILLPLARDGLSVTGIDLSQAMLDRFREQLAAEPEEVRSRTTLVYGDMSAFDLPVRFRLAIVAFRSFQMLTTPEAERSCLEALSRHLEPGGCLVIDIFDPRLEFLTPGEVPSNGVLRTEPESRNPVSGNLVRTEVLSRNNDPVAQVFAEVWRFTELGADGAVLRQESEVLRMRWVYRWEMRYLLELCGFRVLAEYSDFQKSPPAYGHEQIWLCESA